MADEKVAIGGRLRLAREQAGLSQGQVAAKLGLHRPTISEIEAGRRRVGAEEAAMFAKIYKVAVTWIIRGPNEKRDPKQEKAELAARKLAQLKDHDLDLVLDLLASFREQKGRT